MSKQIFTKENEEGYINLIVSARVRVVIKRCLVSGFLIVLCLGSVSAIAQTTPKNIDVVPVISYLLENEIDLNVSATLSASIVFLSENVSIELDIQGDNPLVSIDWGDGTTNSEINHTYSLTGEYTVVVTANEQSGDMQSQIATIGVVTVTAVNIDLDIAGSLSANNLNLYDLVTLTFSVFGDNPVISIDWGDGTINELLTHRYFTPGNYSVVVSATETSGDNEFASELIDVINITQAPAGTYLACFNNLSGIVAPSNLFTNANMSPQMCASHCANEGFSHAGITTGTTCGCGPLVNTFTECDGVSCACDVACPGASGAECGGFFATSLYSTGLGL